MRLLILLLIGLNGLYFGWSEGLFRAYGFAPLQQTEPQRLAQQVRPEALRLLTPAETRKLEEQAKEEQQPKECLLAGPLDETQTATVRRALDPAWPAGSWQIDTVAIPERWIVYMGRYPDAEALAKKRAELATMNLPMEALNNPALEPGLSLGGFDGQAAATQELARLNQRGIRTARVVQERAASTGGLLRLPAVTEALKSRLGELKPLLAGKPLRACPDSAR